MDYKIGDTFTIIEHLEDGSEKATTFKVVEICSEAVLELLWLTNGR